MTTQAVTNHSGKVLVLVLALAMFVALGLVNIPDAAVGQHAIATHGEDAMYALNSWQRGDCCHVWRHDTTNRVVRICEDDTIGQLRHIIMTTLSGCPVTAFDATRGYCRRKFSGWEYIGDEGFCQ